VLRDVPSLKPWRPKTLALVPKTLALVPKTLALVPKTLALVPKTLALVPKTLALVPLDLNHRYVPTAVVGRPSLYDPRAVRN
jgi:hypothetical protein